MDGCLPASTGIGISPGNGSRCAIDLFAALGANGSLHRYDVAGRQRSAYEYGSAFARAAVAQTPAGRTIFVSGTAAIDARGLTCHLDNIPGQIQMTLDNVTAVLSQFSVKPCDAVQAIAYCANSAVVETFVQHYRTKYPWPWLTMIGDVCRPDLLFEVEITVCPGAKAVLA